MKENEANIGVIEGFFSRRSRYRKRKTAKVWPYNPRNFQIDPGDLMVDWNGSLYRAEESSGSGKRRLGELTPRYIKPPDNKARAVIEDGEVYWVWR